MEKSSSVEGKSLGDSIKQYVRAVPDFPKPGIMFRDITPLLKSHEAFSRTLAALTAMAEPYRPTAVIGIESRGFIFAAPLALSLGVPFVPIRKPGKLPAARMQVEYSLEYGTGQLDIHADALSKDDSVVVIDDVLATGGTARGSAKLVEMLGAKVAAFLFVIELVALEGRAKLREYEVQRLIAF
jgi:adenine phosphoribosyltransferase